MENIKEMLRRHSDLAAAYAITDDYTEADRLYDDLVALEHTIVSELHTLDEAGEI